MDLNLKKESRHQRKAKALKENLKKRKIFQKKVEKKRDKKWLFYLIVGLKKWLRKKIW